MAFQLDQRTITGALIGAAIGGGLIYLGATKPVVKAVGLAKNKWVSHPVAGLAAGAALGLAAAYVTKPSETTPVAETTSIATTKAAGVGRVGAIRIGTVSLSDVRDAKRKARIAQAGAREAREETEITRGQRRQERERKKKGLASIDVAQSETTAAEEGYDEELLARRARQFDTDLDAEFDEGDEA